LSYDETMNAESSASTAKDVRRALIDAAEAAYEDAGVQGLCAEGRWEAAVSAMRRLDLDAVAREAGEAAESAPSASADHNRTAGDRNGAVGVSGAPVHPHHP
jgi:ribosomal protein L12E/L44/L45/RPP1/RPP2